jgi:hypothetical protein
MFKEINLSEAEFFGNSEAGSSIKFSRVLDWMKNVKSSSNAKFLKCIVNKALKVKVYSVADITFSENLIHKDKTYDMGVKIAFKEENENVPAMTVARAAELFEKIEALCIENGKDLSTIEVFTEDVNGKLSRFCWYYDDETDTAVIVRNMNPGQARKFMHGGGETIVKKLASVPTNPQKLIDELAAVEEKIKALTAKRDAVLNKFEQLPDTQTA